ncbi:hypothetical protein FRACYDRAFT_231818 [Fragilariopsis cylindrus CCMP1102]|uniref:Uncharacterized protein n=1 Tax=Fragilariopsis cylindrus CCMP1102 TaxID=635003 RepID=A0A1E7FU86_9STRA|nr:hypothetical protein FRACYDRAFT_231818 [Fragilariopsis cylindrus CCMP1102]|eukprot:OEU21677.1 hypothetical protein FRACYDRAFT_231818 [Fragilariopsis cylindrus CCMP1102]
MACTDDVDFRFKDEPAMDCTNWVSAKPKIRCPKRDPITRKRVKSSCPSICRSSCIVSKNNVTTISPTTTSVPSDIPTTSYNNVQRPSVSPTNSSSSLPSSDPTKDTTSSPTSHNSDYPSAGSSFIASSNPSSSSEIPSTISTDSPNVRPSDSPTNSSSSLPSSNPTRGPTSSPTTHIRDYPSVEPSFIASGNPSSSPEIPSSISTDNPSSSSSSAIPDTNPLTVSPSTTSPVATGTIHPNSVSPSSSDTSPTTVSPSSGVDDFLIGNEDGSSRLDDGVGVSITNRRWILGAFGVTAFFSGIFGLIFCYERVYYHRGGTRRNRSQNDISVDEEKQQVTVTYDNQSIVFSVEESVDSYMADWSNNGQLSSLSYSSSASSSPATSINVNGDIEVSLRD